MLSVVLLVEVVSLMVLVDDAAESSNKYCGLTNWVARYRLPFKIPPRRIQIGTTQKLFLGIELS